MVMLDVSIVQTLADRGVQQTVIRLVIQTVKTVLVLAVVKIVHVQVIAVVLHVGQNVVTPVQVLLVKHNVLYSAVALLVLLTAVNHVKIIVAVVLVVV